MPCRNDGPFTDAELGYPRALKAAMCAILSALERHPGFQWLDHCNWKEAGVTKEWLIGWWAEHKRQDEERQQRELELRGNRALAITALSKLSPAEIVALGLHR